MQKSVEKASEGAPDEPQKNSVFDFLYCDTRRIGSFLAQFDDSGHLERVVQRESATKGVKRGFKLNLGAGGIGNVGIERSPTDGGSEAAERTYDPLWANARTLLDYLESAELINQDLANARIGQFVLVSGELSMLQMTLLKELWKGPKFKEKTIDAQANLLMSRILGASGVTDTASAKMNKDKTAVAKQARADALSTLEILATLPHSVQATLMGEGASVWCVLSENCLVPTPSDITLKYGSLVTGDWYALGILDAMPSPIPPPIQIQVPASDIPQHFGAAVSNISNLARAVFGRPAEAYGITPLLIFRKVS